MDDGGTLVWPSQLRVNRSCPRGPGPFPTGNVAGLQVRDASVAAKRMRDLYPGRPDVVLILVDSGYTLRFPSG